MGARSLAVFSLVAFLYGPAPGLAAAQQCGLKQFASLDMQDDAAGQIVVEAKINHAPRWMLIDTGGATSELSRDVADELELKKMPIGNGAQYIAADGSELTHEVIVPEMSIGMLPLRNWTALAVPPRPSWARRHAAGVFAPDVLSKFDLDFDFQHRKLNLFLQDHCEGKVVYWAEAYTLVPFGLSEDGHIRISLSLDGKELDGIVDSGSNGTIIFSPAAHALFGVDANAPGVTTDGAGQSRSRFHELVVGGVAVHNPDIYLMDDKADQAYRRQMGLSLQELGAKTSLSPKMILGTDVLQHLHFYIAYGEHKIYVTAVDAHSP